MTFILDKFEMALGTVLKIAETPSDVDKLETENQKKEFILAFRDLSKLLLILHTFVEFEFDEAKIGISEQDYQDFKSKYLLIYDYVRRAENDRYQFWKTLTSVSSLWRQTASMSPIS
jgi:type I restriction enzyme R subunit